MMAHVFEIQPIEVERFYTGVISQRNKLAIPIRVFGRRLIELYDAILSGSNAEISVRSTLVRAAGNIQYNSNVVSGIPQKFYSFQQSSTQSLFPVIDTTTGVFYVPPGASAPVSLITKTQSKQSSFFGVGNFLYIGNAEFSRKWDGPSGLQGITKWGIDTASVSGSTSAFCGTGADGGTNPWVNPTNIQGAPDGVFTTDALSAGPNTVTFSAQLNATNYGFAIAAGNTINGIQVVISGLQSQQLTVSFPRMFINVTLQNNGSTIGTFKSAVLPTVAGTVTLGSSSDLWGGVLTPAVINSGTFGIQIQAVVNNQGLAGTKNCTFSLDAAQIIVFNSGAPTVTVNAAAGTFSATQGYQYLFSYSNSVDNNIGNPTPASLSTGPFTNKLNVQIGLVASTDPQVNQIRLFRTTDTGTGAVFFELPTSPYPNLTQTVNDVAPDTILQVTQAVVVGTQAFSIPPAGLVNIEWYAGRLWGSVNNLLYFSAGPDNAPMGRGTSDWPPANVFELPTTIVKLIALNGGNGMLVVTLDGIHVVQGISNPGFTVNKWLSDVGARQQNAVDTDGSNVYIFTSDRQFLKISAQGMEELSQNISDQTDNFDPTAVYVMQHRSGSQDSRVFLTDGSTQWISYNLMMGAWEPARTFADGSGVSAIGSIEIQPGTYKLLKGSTTAGSVIQQRDLSTFTDNGSAYSWNVIFGNIPIADPSQLANIENLIIRLSLPGTLPTVSILPNDTAGAFSTITRSVQEPPESNTTPTGYVARRYYLGDSPVWTQMTHLQVQLAFTTDTVQNELLSWGLFPNQSTDQQTQQLPQVQGR